MSPNFTEKVYPTPSQTKNRLKMALGGLFVIAICVAARYYWGGGSADAAAPAKSQAQAANSSSPTATPTKATTPPPSQPNLPANEPTAPSAVVATVNTHRITGADLSRECLRQHGKDVLESMVNKQLIIQECKRQNVNVTTKEVNDEIERMAQRFNIPVDKWLKMLKQERNITPTQYAQDIIWPTLALRRLAGERLEVTKDEMAKEYEMMYGEQIRARLIAVTELSKAKRLQAEAAADPEKFGNLAKEESEDAPSAGAKGVIQPIRKHGSYKEIEDAVFNMADGEVSGVIKAGPQYVILKREGLIPARQVNFEEVSSQLEEVIRDRKMRTVAQDLYKSLQDNAKIENVWNDPAKHAKFPDVAAIINGSPIMVQDLAQECTQRHGTEVLEGMINRTLIEDACTKRNVAVNDQDIQKEIEEQAAARVKPNPDGTPNVQAWMDLVTKKNGIGAEIYRSQVVWPSVALKKLVGEKVEVTEEDLKKGYDSNFGPRVHCLAIVLDNQRRALQVFEMARKNNTPEYFGELASQYSVEPGSQALRGEVPPIKLNGGQPILEKEAFALKPGELSGVIPVDDKFVILRCQTIKEGAHVDFAKVRDDIYQDLLEKKTQIAMRTFFEDLQNGATIDNYLAKTSHSPNQEKKGGERPQGGETLKSAGNVPVLRQVKGE